MRWPPTRGIEMDLLLSVLLPCLGQAGALLLFLLHGERDLFRRRRLRGLLIPAYYLLLCLLQLGHQGTRGSAGVMDRFGILFLLASWLLTVGILLLWRELKWDTCLYTALLILLIDGCVWPFAGNISQFFWGFNLLSLLVRMRLPALHKIRLSRYELFLALSIAFPALFFRVYMGRVPDQVDRVRQVVVTLCSLISILALTGEVGRSSSEYEKLREERMQSVLRQQQAMFEQKLSDADLINRKYHDMKNLLLYLRTGNGGRETAPAIDELLRSIEPYGAAVATGSDVIDVILNEKLVLCARKEITCIPYLDGSLLSFVRPLDLCTLIGNAMDNAIESCQQIPEPERRRIHLHTAVQGNAVILTVRNTFAQKPDLRDGLPASTKGDAANPGYGLRNMRYLAEQYGGVLSCRIEGEEFVLNVLLSPEGA